MEQAQKAALFSTRTDEDPTASSAFRASYPLDFFLRDNAGHPVLSSLGPQTLTLGIRNTSTAAVVLGEPEPPPGSKDDDLRYHFILRFRQGTLLEDLDNIHLPDDGWRLERRNRPWQEVDELLIQGEAGHTIDAGETRILALTHVQAQPGTRTTQVEFLYHSLQHGTGDLAGQREKSLGVVSQMPAREVRVQPLPIFVNFAGANTVLNDADPDSPEAGSTSILRVQLTNVSHNRVAKTIRFATLGAGSGQDQDDGTQANGNDPQAQGRWRRSKIILSFDVNDREVEQQTAWALGSKSEVAGIQPHLTGPDGERWETTYQSQGTKAMWIFTPDDAGDATELPAGRSLELTIENIRSSLPSGPTNLHLRCVDVPGYPNRDYVLTVQKTPLVYNDSLVGIGTADPTHGLHIAGHDKALRLTGTGSHGAGAKLEFGDTDLVYLHEDADDDLTIYAHERLALKANNVRIEKSESSDETALTVDGNIDAQAGTFSTITGELNGNDITEESIALSKLVKAVQEALCPVGTILPYAGDEAPDGWLMCNNNNYTDGRYHGHNPESYPALFKAIGYRFGGFTNNGVHWFMIPDLRGRFLRGRDGGAGRDPDRGSRQHPYNEGAAGDAVGSVQEDAFKSHFHQSRSSSGYHSPADVDNTEGEFGAKNLWENTTLEVGNDDKPVPKPVSETRPKNMYVNFIIKY
jgi:hypothetical protein